MRTTTRHVNAALRTDLSKIHELRAWIRHASESSPYLDRMVQGKTVPALDRRGIAALEKSRCKSLGRAKAALESLIRSGYVAETRSCPGVLERIDIFLSGRKMIRINSRRYMIVDKRLRPVYGNDGKMVKAYIGV